MSPLRPRAGEVSERADDRPTGGKEEFDPDFARERTQRATVAKGGWVGADLNRRLPPCEGGIITSLDHRPRVHDFRPRKINVAFSSRALPRSLHRAGSPHVRG